MQGCPQKRARDVYSDVRFAKLVRGSWSSYLQSIPHSSQPSFFSQAPAVSFLDGLERFGSPGSEWKVPLKHSSCFALDGFLKRFRMDMDPARLLPEELVWGGGLAGRVLGWSQVPPLDKCLLFASWGSPPPPPPPNKKNWGVVCVVSPRKKLFFLNPLKQGVPPPKKKIKRKRRKTRPVLSCSHTLRRLFRRMDDVSPLQW